MALYASLYFYLFIMFQIGKEHAGLKTVTDILQDIQYKVRCGFRRKKKDLISLAKFVAGHLNEGVGKIYVELCSDATV